MVWDGLAPEVATPRSRLKEKCLVLDWKRVVNMASRDPTDLSQPKTKSPSGWRKLGPS
jgi:hypothetical protein